MKFLLHESIFIILLISSTICKKLTLQKLERLTGITYYIADLTRVYVCNDYLFYNETKALLYQDKIYDDYKKIKSKFIPDGGIKDKIKTMKNKYIIGENKGGRFYEINPFTELCKKNIWGVCVDCYYKISNSELRKRLLEEINFYRKLHGVPSVSYHSKYNNYAKEEAKKFLKTNKSSSCVHQTKFGCVYLPVPDIFVQFTINSIYEKLLAYYDWKKNAYKSKLESAIQLIWKKARYIGISFAQEDYFVFIFLTFSSKVKNDKNYKKNVRPIMSKYIKQYGTLPKTIQFGMKL
ncbi:CAP domain-containing protein [Strongyloides ratti]|uniref:CAP domain-containing protein n=1 Tax=Strongyloides ratti TaxID=34506 RepID=A0A090L7R7_STRRB|nr:CAP domain-containing protein [Strongyloides ratti]CEF63564.2 CAP domain-containing protein [Strongyloides ratti]